MRTREQLHARATGSLKAFFRVHEPLCAKFLTIGKDPAHFPAVRAAWPFIRTAAVLELPQTWAMLPTWGNLAFNAGLLFGQRMPGEAEEILEHRRLDGAEALRGVKLLRDTMGRNCPTIENAFEVIHGLAFRSIPMGLLPQYLISTSFDAFKVGLAAGTLALADPDLVEFAEALQPPIAAVTVPLNWRATIWAPLLSHGHSIVESLAAHPLLQVAAAYYPRRPVEKDTIRPFWAERLAACGPLREEQCPAGKRDIEVWVRSGLEFARRIATDNPARLREVFAETGDAGLAALRRVIGAVVTQAGGAEPTALTGAILRWHEKTNRSFDPGVYGSRLDRVVMCADFAIWAEWLFPAR